MHNDRPDNRVPVASGASLPTKKGKSASHARPPTHSEVELPDRHRRELELGPKFCFEPRLQPVDKVVLARGISRHADEDERSRCVNECVEAFARSSGEPRKRNPVKPLAEYLVSHDLRALVSDKEGFFFVLPEGKYQEKAMSAVDKNFKKMSVNLAEKKQQALSLLEDLNLESVAQYVKKAPKLNLEVFFTAKTHKTDIPFRAVVSERATWQIHVSAYLQKCLMSLNLAQPFLVKNSETIIEYLENEHLANIGAFSIDVEDMYYSLPQNPLLVAVEECIKVDNDELAFRNCSGISVESFLELLSFYLNSTFVGFNDGIFLQKSGVCIGSKVAPLLSDIFLCKVDRALERELSGMVKKVYRYVDDYIVFVDKCSILRSIADILKVFKENGMGLKYTFEVMKENCIQFLDLSLKFGEEHVCWKFAPRSVKPLLNYKSGHSKLVKNSIAFSSLRSALFKSCVHSMGASFKEQVKKLTEAGFPNCALASACNKLVKVVKGCEKPATQREPDQRKKYAVVPYIHRTTHRLKKIASRYGVQVAISAPNKLGRVCALVNRKKQGSGANNYKDCSVKHNNKYVTCCICVVYQIPLSCGRVYVGQTGRCINVRLREHFNSLKGTPTSHMSEHCRSCSTPSCEPILDKTVILFNHSNQRKREIIEASHITKLGDACISHASVCLQEKEVAFLDCR